MRYLPARHPLQSDICVICPAKDHKRAALIYNRIFVPAADLDFLDTPPEVTFGDDLGPNHPTWDSWFEGLNGYSLTNRGMLGYDHYIAICYGQNGLTVVRGFSGDAFRNDTIDIKISEKHKSDPQCAIADASALPVHENKVVAYSAVLSNMPLISSSTSWGEILEFRKDKWSLEKSRRLRMWMRDASRATSATEAQDIVSQLLDDYTAAMRKHSIKTVAGGLTLVAAAGGAALAAWTTGATIIGALSAGIGMTAGTVAWILKQHCDYDDIERSKGAEVSVFYEAAKRFGQ